MENKKIKKTNDWNGKLAKTTNSHGCGEKTKHPETREWKRTVHKENSKEREKTKPNFQR